jgi:hypothetical protein
MLAMQYSIELPYHYDTNLVRARVKERVALFKGVPGLLHKSYLLNEEDKIYAPFYVWSDVAEARKFLFDDLFRGVITAFRRPRVRTWMVMDSITGNPALTPRFARRESDIIAPEEHDLEGLFRRETEAQTKLKSHPALYFHMVALDAERWELVRYSLWRDEASAPPSHADITLPYEVLDSQSV